MKHLMILISTFSLVAMLATSCKKEETINTTDTGTTSTTTPADTSGTTTTNAMGTSGTTSTGSPLSDADKTFVMKAAGGGMTEVKLGELAAANAKSADVKAFGQRMVTDHGKANDELSQFAATKGLTLPPALDAEHQKTYDELAKKNGAAFDKAYMDDMVKDHVMDVDEFKKQSTAANDPDLKAWVTKTLPTLEDHLKMAKETQKKVK
ncbi:MAG: DUF4142 domain-containing protein [Thermoanaerobaculia bacterium]